MPKRRTDDVVHAVMTDHFIQRKEPERNLLAERSEPESPENHYLGEVIPYYPTPLPPLPENELYLALAQVREDNNLDRGIDQFAAALEKYQPTQAEFYSELADARLRRHQAKEAIALYQEAVRRNPDSLAGLLGLGTALEQSEQHAMAADTFRRAIQLYPANALLWQELAHVYVSQGQRTEALKAVQKSLELDRDVPEAHLLLGKIWGQDSGDLERAEASTREAIRLWPNYAQAHVNLAIFLFQENRIEEASYHFEYALRLQPGYALGHFDYGLMFRSLGRVDEAVQQMRAAVQAEPNYAEAHEALGALAESSGKMEEAILEYSEAVKINPQFSQAQLELGAALVKTGNLEEAAQHLTQASLSSDSSIRQEALRLLSDLGK